MRAASMRSSSVTESHRRRRAQVPEVPQRHPAPALRHRLTLGWCHVRTAVVRARMVHASVHVGRVGLDVLASPPRTAPAPRPARLPTRRSGARCLAPRRRSTSARGRGRTPCRSLPTARCAARQAPIAIFAASAWMRASLSGSHAATASATSARLCAEGEVEGLEGGGGDGGSRAPGTTRSRRSTRFRRCSTQTDAALSFGRAVSQSPSPLHLSVCPTSSIVSGLSMVILLRPRSRADDGVSASPRISTHLELIAAAPCLRHETPRKT